MSGRPPVAHTLKAERLALSLRLLPRGCVCPVHRRLLLTLGDTTRRDKSPILCIPSSRSRQRSCTGTWRGHCPWAGLTELRYDKHI